MDSILYLPALNLVKVTTCRRDQPEGSHIVEDDEVVLLTAPEGKLVRVFQNQDLQFVDDESMAFHIGVLNMSTCRFELQLLRSSDWSLTDRADLGESVSTLWAISAGKSILVRNRCSEGEDRYTLYIATEQGSLLTQKVHLNLGYPCRGYGHKRRKTFILLYLYSPEGNPPVILEIDAMTGKLVERRTLNIDSDAIARHGSQVLGDDYWLNPDGSLMDLDDGSVLHAGLFDLIPDWPDKPVLWEL